MPHSNGRIYRNTSTSPAQGLDFIGDISYVLGVGSGDLGYIIANGNINKFAKYKAFGYQSWGFADNTARNTALRLTRYGFSTAAGHIAPSAGVTWTYTRPTGGSSQPYRALDFDGYYHYAPCPFKLEASVKKGTGSIYSAKGYISVVLSVNQGVNQSWNANDCMSIQDFFDASNTPGADDLWDYYHIAFKIINKDRGYTLTLIETNTTLKQAFSNQNTYGFSFPEVDYSSEWNYLEILNEAHLGDRLEVMALLLNASSMTNSYKIYTGNDANIWTSGFSLALDAGVDRYDAVTSSVYSMNGTVGTLTGVNMRDDGTATFYGVSSHKYFPTLNMTIDTRGASGWGTLPNGLQADLVIEIKVLSLQNTFIEFSFDGTPEHSSRVSDTYDGGYRTITWRNTVQLASGRSTTYSRNLFSYGQYIDGQLIQDPDTIYVGRPTSGPNTATITISARLERPGDNTVYLGTYGPIALSY